MACRRRHFLCTAAFTLSLVALGLLLYERLPPEPFAVIPLRSRLAVDAATGFRWIGDSWPLSGPMGPLDIWDSRTGCRTATFLNSAGEIRDLVFSNSGRYLAAIGEDGKCHLVDLQKGQESLPAVCHVPPDPPWVTGLRIQFSPGEKFLAVWHMHAKTSGICHLIECATGRLLKTFSDLFGPEPSVRPPLFTTDDEFFLRTTRDWDDCRVDLINTRSLRAGGSLKMVSPPYEISPDGRTLLGKSPEGLALYDLQSLQHRLLSPGPVWETHFWGSWYTHGAFSSDSKVLITVRIYEGHLVEAWDVATGKRRGQIHVPGSVPNRGLAALNMWFISPDSKLFVHATSTGLDVWDIEGGRRLWDTKDVLAPPRWTADSRHLIFRTDRHGLGLLDSRTGRLLKSLPSNDFSHDHDPGFDLAVDDRYVLVRDVVNTDESWVPRLLRTWLRLGLPEDTRAVSVFDLQADGTIARLEDGTLSGEAELLEGGRTLVTHHGTEHDEPGSLRFWHLPLRPPLRWVLGIPAGIAALFGLAWLARRLRSRG